MAKRGKRRAGKRDDDEALVSDEVRKSVFAILLVAFGAIMLLSFFGLAGSVGDWFDNELATILGISRLVVPVLLILMGGSAVIPQARILSFRGWLALLFCILALDGLLNLILARDPNDLEALRRAGGQVGLLTSALLVQSVGFVAALIIALAVFAISIILFFNISLPSIFAFPGRLFGRRENNEDAEAETAEVEPVAIAEEVIEETTIDEDGQIKANRMSRLAAAFMPAKNEEEIMVSTERRKIEVPLDLLDNRRSQGKAGDINRSQEIIMRTLEQFGITVEMAEVKVGPTVTQYSFRPAHGVKLSRIVALQNDLALALAAHPIRIEAPIPGKALVGVEVPNQSVARVSLREVLESKEFAKRKGTFGVPLGKDISGGVPMLFVDKAPHMLVAGATGSGKSVCLNGIIVSLLYQNGPDDLKLIMVDPKRVELGIYAGIPHLLVPPITKAEEAINALKWAVREMDRRLDYLAKFGARDIDSYNAKSEERMPRIIIVIDELADLMIQNKREVEAVIVRIAQMARAAGIHLVLATQRPSVDVITGTIKANIPTRLAFAVASQVDSKTILDTAGADKLLGRGDMLMSTPELSKPKRVQGAYLADGEIGKVVNFLKKESEPDYNYQITEGASSSGGTTFNSEDKDVLLEDAIEIAIEAGRVSTSFLQRRMKIGYSRAARIVDIMEEMGVVGAADGAKPREVLISEWPPAGMNVASSAGAAPRRDQYQEPDEIDEAESTVLVETEDEEDEELDAIMEEAEPEEEEAAEDDGRAEAR